MRDAGRVRDWIEWHEAYEDPASSLSRRLAVVRRRLGEALDDTADRPCQLLSLCAGDGRDTIPVLAARPASSPISALLVEQDADLARQGAESVSAAGLDAVRVRCADAGDPASFGDVPSVDLLLLCGIFGNIEHGRVQGLIGVLHHLLAPGSLVIWTRGASEPDRRSDVRRWFVASGFDEVSFDGAPESFGVGVNRLGSTSRGDRRQLPRQLFQFVHR